jgi:NAD(P)-dependent dehydrogenase (short-subunit alcohol dehydrogenase family)
MAIPERSVTKDNVEMQFGTNHLGHFVLTNELIGSLKMGAPSRVVNVSSMAHRRAGISWEDVNLTNDYNDWKVSRMTFDG